MNRSLRRALAVMAASAALIGGGTAVANAASGSSGSGSPPGNLSVQSTNSTNTNAESMTPTQQGSTPTNSHHPGGCPNK